MMAKCISLSNYNLSSTNVLIIGAGIGWCVLGVCPLLGGCAESRVSVCHAPSVTPPASLPVQRVRLEGLPEPFCPTH